MNRPALTDWLTSVQMDMDESARTRFEDAAKKAFKASSTKVVETIEKIINEAKASRKQRTPQQIKHLEWAECATKVLMYLQDQATIEDGNLTEDLQENAETWYEEYLKSQN